MRAIADAATSMQDATESPARRTAKDPRDDGPAEDAATRDLVLRNDVGLHARPAAMLSRLAAQFDAAVLVNAKPAASVLSLMSLGLEQGDAMHLTATGPQAGAALDAIERLVERNFAGPDVGN